MAISRPKLALYLPELAALEPELQVAFGVLAQAAQDAVSGDAEAAEWLATTGADWADELAGDAEYIFVALAALALSDAA